MKLGKRATEEVIEEVGRTRARVMKMERRGRNAK